MHMSEVIHSPADGSHFSTDQQLKGVTRKVAQQFTNKEKTATVKILTMECKHNFVYYYNILQLFLATVKKVTSHMDSKVESSFLKAAGKKKKYQKNLE